MVINAPGNLIIINVKIVYISNPFEIKCVYVMISSNRRNPFRDFVIYRKGKE